MPVYDYVCSRCAERVEIIHAVHAPGPESCPVCGGQMRKALSVPAIVFKGSGWAKKDARASVRRSEKEAKDGPAADASDGGTADRSEKPGTKEAKSTAAD
jgi:putative FmdB family regulatory protein